VTGSEHFTAAARLAADAQSIEAAIHAEDDRGVRDALERQHARITARGQVHATLAVAAAAADGGWNADAWKQAVR
jgi:hypothetical protein